MWERVLNTIVDWVLGSGLTIVFAVILTFILLAVGRGLLHRLKTFLASRDESIERNKRIETMVAVLRHVVSITIIAVASLVVISELGFDLTPILTTVGITGLAISFGAQSLVKDIISGFFMLIEDQVRVGDVVKIESHGGIVEALTLRTITLRDLQGNVHIIPNGEITAITNMTKEYGRMVLDIGVAYKEDVDRVMKLLADIGEQMQQEEPYNEEITEPVEILGVEDFADSAVIIRMRITTTPIKQWAVAREFRRRIKKRFDAEGIEIPFPHQTIYWGKEQKPSS
ncbi:MAG TPA: mechanosensitive ion channel family protein [Acidobacteriota bacterium]|nr:mechanosensitive ion channel family protein [Acidobacteriota bacterium]